MKITALSLTPPKGAENNPRVTHELLASVLAKYSRSNEGLETILGKVDLNNPEASIANILKFVDYGHASIGGLTGGIAIAIDDVTMFAAYKLFELSPMADGQESSTRYITLDERGLPNWESLGFNTNESEKLQAWAVQGLSLYKKAYAKLDAEATAHPELIKIPEKLASKPAAVNRLRKNYALDRARYFLPFAMKTNVALIQTARMWTETLSGLYSSNVPELVTLAHAIKHALEPYAPNLIRHARAKKGWTHHTKKELRPWKGTYKDAASGTPSTAEVELFTAFTDQEIADALSDRENRYDRCGLAARDTTIRCKWTGMTIAELRDLNRHRTGNRYSDLNPKGFYLPPETLKALQDDKTELQAWEEASKEVLMLTANLPEFRPYALALGSQVGYTHTQQFDKFVYTAELRTGAGAHFRYAKHFMDAVGELYNQGFKKTYSAIQVGEAEPE